MKADASHKSKALLKTLTSTLSDGHAWTPTDTQPSRPLAFFKIPRQTHFHVVAHQLGHHN
jgi:hypothetical protein